MTSDTQEIVAAILTAAKIQTHRAVLGRSDEAGYLAEFQRMLDEMRKTYSSGRPPGGTPGRP